MKTLNLLLLAAFTLPALADVAKNVDVDQAFARAAIQQQRNSAAFMTLSNNGEAAYLAYAKSPVAEIVELHTHINDQGVMRMRKIDRIDLPSGEAVMLKPGGLHVMLLGLQRDLNVGERIVVTLGFNDGSEKQLDVPVRRVMMKHKKGSMMNKSNPPGSPMMVH